MVAGREEGVGTSNMDVALPQLFDETTSKVSGFIIECKLSRSLKVNFVHFYFLSFIFLFLFFFILYFYFQNNSGQGLSVTLSHQSQLDGIVTRLITGLKRMKQKKLEQSDVIQHGHHMLASCITHGHLGQGAQQLARTMGISI